MSIATSTPLNHGRAAAGRPDRPGTDEILARLLRAGGWSGRVRFDLDQRWYSRIGEQDGYEAWLLSWLPGQSTELHDHGRAAGGFAVVSGALTELTVLGRGTGLTTQWVRWTAGELRRFGPGHVHQLRNDTEEPAVSLHVYSPALTSMTHYAIRREGLVPVGVGRAGVTW